ncbi:MAG: flagellar filament capping protein FliD, partial [Bacteroides sp.]|nr:flagellar filament capping protein FliD [Bacteroides sp.]
FNSLSNRQNRNVTLNADGTTTMGQIAKAGTITGVYEGGAFTVTASNDKTIGDVLAELAGYGISGSISNGVVTLRGTNDGYITNFGNAFGLTGSANTTTVTTTISGFNTNSEIQNRTIVTNMTEDTQLKDLTDSSGNNLNITNGQIYAYRDGTRIAININNNDTIATLNSKFAQYGITANFGTDGKIYYDGSNDSYLTTGGIGANASNILSKLGISGDWSTRYDSDSKKLQYTTTSNNVVNEHTKLKQLNNTSGRNLGITNGEYTIYQNGVRTTETITDDTTVGDLIASLGSYGMIANLDADGSINIGAYNNTYIATSAGAGAKTNLVTTLFAEWDFVNIYTSNGLSIPADVTVAVSRTTKLADINEGTYSDGNITVIKDGVQTNISLTADDTLGTLMDELALYGFDSVINDKGQLILKNKGNSIIQTYSGSNKKSNILDILGITAEKWISTDAYDSKPIEVIKTSTFNTAATRETELSKLGITTGEYNIFANGVKYTAYISSDETLGSFIDTLTRFGLTANLIDNGTSSLLKISGAGDVYVAKSASTTSASNVANILFPAANNDKQYNYTAGLETSTIVTTHTNATSDTLLSNLDIVWGNSTLKAKGDLSVKVDGLDNIIKISDDDTIGTLINKFEQLGLIATLSDGVLMIQSGYKDFTINNTGTSSLVANLGLAYNDDLGGYSASNDTCQATTTVVEERSISSANYADGNTKLSQLNISSGSLSIFRDGQRAVIQVNQDETFNQLHSRITTAFADANIRFVNGYLEFYSTSGASIDVGSTTDTSNFSAICGVSNDGTGVVRSARELYKVNGESVITTAGLFRKGDVTEGSFIIGTAEFNITNSTTLSDIISQINASEGANATAYWDSVDGKLVIKSRTTGASFINIEAGTSNFTDIMGYTITERNANGSIKTTRLDVNLQNLGKNAVFKINGTRFTSTSNTIGSDISRITGVTINLKGINEDGGSTTLTIEKDKETVATAVSDIVDAYNLLIENVDKEVARGAQLSDQFTLKLIRNQIRTLMTSSIAGTSVFKNLDAIGISLDKASASNIRTDNINVLSFNKDKFIQAFEADRDAVKELLVGNETRKGIFVQVEDIIEQAVAGVTGYFSAAEKSYDTKIKRIDSKITRAKKDAERYKARLEAKFASMDLLIAKFQNQYSSFLGM